MPGKDRWWVVGVVVLAVLVAGCGQGTGGGRDGDGVAVLAKAEGWRAGLQEAAGHPYALVEVAWDAADAERAWADNVPATLPVGEGEPSTPGVYRTLDSVDLERQAVVVYSSGESGTCPVWVREIDGTSERVEVRLRSSAGPGEPCTDDFRPYRLVLAVDRDRLPPPEALPVERVDVPSENLTDVEGRVVAYPPAG